MHPLSKKITALQRRLVLRERGVAVCRILATLIGAALVLGLIDYVLRFSDPGLRIMATSALVAATLWALYRWWYLPSRSALVPLSVARRVEAHFPQLNDSLASALEFLQQSEEDRTAGSAQLRRLVVAHAENTIDGLPMDEVIDRRPLRRAAAWLAAASVGLALCLAWDAGAVRTAMARLAAPLGTTAWPRQHHLAFRNPPTRLAAGQTFEVELVDLSGQLPDEVRIEYRTAQSGRRDAAFEPMKRSGDVMVARRENIRTSFAFRAAGGDDDTMPWHTVEVVDPPQLESLSITVHPPAYSGLPAKPAQRHLDVISGSGIEMRGVASEALSAAQILPQDAKPIPATITSDEAGRERRGFRVAPGRWIATSSGSYRIELADDGALAGVVGRWNLRVEPDSPPSVSWQTPRDDLYVLREAVVPIRLAVKDNLAVHRVELNYERSDRSEAERERQPTEPSIAIYEGPAEPIPVSSEVDAAGDRRVVEYSWDLAPLGLPVGAELVVAAEAADYRPGVGRTPGPRRIMIINADELEARLVDQQSQLVRQLERALTSQQSTREEVRRLEIQQRDVGSLTAGDRKALQAAELNQRRVGRTLVDPAEGLPALSDAMLEEIEINRLASSPMRATLERLAEELRRMSAGPLSVAERELTAARKTIDALGPDDAAASGDRPLSGNDRRAASLGQSLSAAGAAQDDVIFALERLISELSSKADHHRFTRLLVELREDQMAHERAARQDIGLETLPLRVDELTRAQLAKLNKAAAGQNALADRYDKIERGIDELAQALADEQDDVADTLSDALSLARELAIGAKMRQTAVDLGENRVGGALARETQIAEDIQQLVAILRNTSEQRPERLADKLREAEQRLAELRAELAELGREIAQAERQPATTKDLARLSDEQQRMRREIDRLARRLDRLQAEDAGESTRHAARKLVDQSAPGNQPPQAAQKPASSNQVQKAEADLEQAANQLAARRQQAEDDLALEFVRRFQAELSEMVERQRQVIEDTANVDTQRQPGEPPGERIAQRIGELADEERRLAQMAKEHSELLFGLGAVRVSLESAEQRLTAAAELLQERDTGPRARRAEEQALARLEGMMQAFAQTANDAAQNPADPAGAGDPNQQQQRRPTFELLEVKMLRMLQVDLHKRTREHEQRVAALDGPPEESLRAEMQREARELAAEQGRLAELVQDMLTRDNEEDE
jgi:hypothetical protein